LADLNCISAVVTINSYRHLQMSYLMFSLSTGSPSQQTGVLNWPLIHICWPSHTGVRSAFLCDSWAFCLLVVCI